MQYWVYLPNETIAVFADSVTFYLILNYSEICISPIMRPLCLPSRRYE